MSNNSSSNIVSRKESRMTKFQKERFHGAFTGGFSAGYYNTVGSEEGWTPSQFVSSRSTRSSQSSTNKPEDFMDDEDLNEAHVAGKTLVAQANFSKSKKEKETIGDMAVVHSESVGVRLLRTMGWTPNQAIGGSGKKHALNARVIGPQLPSASSAEDDQHSPLHITSAFKNMSLKRDVFGLGYVPDARERALLLKNEWSRNKGKRTVAMSGDGTGDGALLGLSALEADDNDAMFDHVYTSSTAGSKHESASRALTDAKTTPPLEFVKAKNSQAAGGRVFSEQFPALRVPRNFVPTHRFSNERDMSISSELQNHLGEYRALVESRRRLTAADRSRLLGEKRLPSSEHVESNSSAKVSVVDKEKLTASLESNFQVGDQLFAGNSSNTGVREDDAKQELKLQYPLDQGKQARFEQFLSSKATGKPYAPSKGYESQWQHSREVVEFNEVYQRISQALTERLKGGEQQSSKSSSGENGRRLLVPGGEGMDRETAAKLKMFGDLTREVEDFVPDRLLCKRFQVSNPWKDGTPEVKKKTDGVDRRFKEMLSAISSSADSSRVPAVHVAQDTGGTKTTMKDASDFLHSVLENDDEGVESEKPPPPLRSPPMSLYKAIFANNGDSDSDDGDKKSSSGTPLPLVSSSDTPPKVRKKSRWDVVATLPSPQDATTNNMFKNSQSHFTPSSSSSLQHDNRDRSRAQPSAKRRHVDTHANNRRYHYHDDNHSRRRNTRDTYERNDDDHHHHHHHHRNRNRHRDDGEERRSASEREDRERLLSELRAEMHKSKKSKKKKKKHHRHHN